MQGMSFSLLSKATVTKLDNSHTLATTSVNIKHTMNIIWLCLYLCSVRVLD